MLCKDAEELIKSYKMGTINAENFLLLIQHTKECPKCAVLFEAVESSASKDQSNNVSAAIKQLYQKYSTFIKKKQQENKFYTKRWFYILLIVIFIGLSLLGVISNFSFNNFYFFTNTFMVITTFITLVMLLTVEE